MPDLGPVLDSFEFDIVNAEEIHPIHIDGEYYAVMYMQSTSSAWIKTYRILPDGTISEIDTWEFTTTAVKFGRIKHITGTLYALTWWNGGIAPAHVYIKTFRMSDTGIITKSFEDESVDLSARGTPILMQIWGSYYALVFSGYYEERSWYTYTIVGGLGGVTLIDSYQDAGSSYDIMAAGVINNNIIFSVSTEDGSYGIHTVYIDNLGIITKSIVDTQNFAVNVGHSSINIAKVGPNAYAAVMRDVDTSKVSIQTFHIGNDGLIQDTLVDRYDFGTCLGAQASLCAVNSGTRHFIVWPGVDGDGYIDIKKIDLDGIISDDDQYTEFEFDIAQCLIPQPLGVNGEVMPVFYQGVDGDGWLKSITFSAPPVGGHHEMIMNIGP